MSKSSQTFANANVLSVRSASPALEVQGCSHASGLAASRPARASRPPLSGAVARHRATCLIAPTFIYRGTRDPRAVARGREYLTELLLPRRVDLERQNETFPWPWKKDRADSGVAVGPALHAPLSVLEKIAAKVVVSLIVPLMFL